MPLTDKEIQDNLKNYYSEKEIKLIENIGIFLGRAVPEKTPEQEEALKIYRDILEDSLEQRMWETRKYYWAFFIFVIIVLAIVIGWFWGRRNIQSNSF